MSKPKPNRPPVPKQNGNGSEPEGFREAEELPQPEELDRIVLMPRDPQWLHAYWGIPHERFESACAEVGAKPETAKTMLRIHDVTERLDRSTGRPRLAESKDYETVELDPSAEHWYIRAKRPGRLYCVEYVVVGPDGRMVALAVSNLAAAPSDHISEDTEETWTTGAAGRGRVIGAVGPARTKWLLAQASLHEALSSSGSGSRPEPPPPERGGRHGGRSS